MNEFFERPLFFQKNRVRRIYTGGARFAEFFGDQSVDGNYPEEWICSSVEALNDGEVIYKEGVSRLESGEYFDELCQKYPEELFGKGRQEMGVLVKMLDSSIRLPVQAHPTKEFSRKHFGSDFGKTESWIILATSPDACVYFGFNKEYSLEEFKAAFDADEKTLVSMLNRVPVKPRDVLLIPAGAIHAIGAGCLLLEVQEPTDFTIQPEKKCGDTVLSQKEKFLTLDPDVAFECFDMSLYGYERSLAAAECKHERTGNVQELISYDDTPCFAVRRYYIDQKECVLPSPSVYVMTEGEAILTYPGGSRGIKKGDYFFAPAALGESLMVKSEYSAHLIQCDLPKTE